MNEGRGGGFVSFRFQEKVMSHYIQYKQLPCIKQLTVYRQNYKQTETKNTFTFIQVGEIFKT